MTTPISTSADEVLGARLLREIAVEEGTLETVRRGLSSPAAALIDKHAKLTTLFQLLKDLRASHNPRPERTGIPELDRLWRNHGGKLAIVGRGLPLLYHIVNQLVEGRGGTVAVLDVDGRFSPSHLDCELRHVHVFRPTKSNLKVTLESVEGYILWGDHGSKDREWMATIVHAGVGGDIMTGWRGWLKVERERVQGFEAGISVEEALIEREMGQENGIPRGWRAVSQYGTFSWT
jgi:hypothetical protein